MATKRTSKKKAARKTASERASARKRSKPSKAKQGSFKSTLGLVLFLFVGLTIALALTYHFSPYSVRGKMERIGLSTVNALRSPEWMPKLISEPLEWIHDCIPNNEGMIVDGGELGHDDSPFIAGHPQSKVTLRTLTNQSSINLFNDRERQTACIAVRLSPNADERASVASTFYDDPRVPNLKAAQLAMGEWRPQALIPAKYLAPQFGPTGANEAQLASNLVPMKQSLAEGTWAKLIQRLASDYPDRFGEIRLYTGPAYRVNVAKLATGVPVPDGFYAIAFHLTESGGLRAIAFLVPHDHEVKRLRDCITSIAQIEEVTGFNFLPELDYDAHESLRNWISPELW